jgi:hypothetical protein
MLVRGLRKWCVVRAANRRADARSACDSRRWA